MDGGDSTHARNSEEMGHNGTAEAAAESPGMNNSTAPARELPDDLPKSLDDRRSIPAFQPETEMYDAWQGSDFYPFFSFPVRRRIKEDRNKRIQC